MYNPTLRLLTILELLQAREQMSGTELAQRLEVDNRSVRRYVTMLQDLGVPVESSRGRYGTYRLRPGFKLPPLMFTDEEALAVTLGLLTIQTNGLAFATPSVSGALAKVERVLPASLRERSQVLQQVIALGPHMDHVSLTVSGDLVLQMSQAVYQHQQVWLVYCSEKGDQTERLVDPYGLAYWVGRWYMVGYCHLREGIRAYRLDRMIEARLEAGTFDAPADFDCTDYLLHSFGTFSHTWEVEVLLKTTLLEAQKKIPRVYGTLEAQPEGVLYRCRIDDMEDMARFLVNLRFKFMIIGPTELRTALRHLAEEINLFADSQQTS